jgi:hypothetical protein
MVNGRNVATTPCAMAGVNADSHADSSELRQNTNRRFGVHHHGALGYLKSQALVRRWAPSYYVLKSNVASSFVAPNGPTSVLELLGQSPSPLAATGSLSAVRIAPVAARHCWLHKRQTSRRPPRP